MDGISDRAERLVAEQQFGVEKSFEICMGMYSTVKTYNLKEHIIQPYQNPIHTTEPIFYYHSDHLGSASFLTDNNGNETQQLVYLPFGEDWVDKKYNSPAYTTPYKFNGKEKDLESGYNYYGARYYCDWLNIWLSVDPLSDRGPWISSYAYCFNNPIQLTDPDGKWPISAPFLFLYLKKAKEMESFGKTSNIRQLGYAMQHPINAARVGSAIDGGCNISSTAHNFAFNIQKRLGLSGGKEGDQRNAIRHTLWQAIITKEMGTDHAERIGNAHEDNLDVDLSKRIFGSIDQADKAVDLLNNNIGRKIGADNKGASNKTLAGKVMETFYKQGLWTVTRNGDGSFSIQREKISREQYNAAMKEINKKNNNGLDS